MGEGFALVKAMENPQLCGTDLLTQTDKLPIALDTMDNKGLM